MNKWMDWKELKSLSKIGLPIFILQLTQVGMGVVDTMVAGRASTTDLSAVALGAAIIWPVFISGSGILTILGPIISHLRGSNRLRQTGVMTNQAFWLALGITILAFTSIIIASHFLHLFTDDTALMATSKGYIDAILWGIIPFMGFIVLRSLNEGLMMTRPAMLIGVFALILNIPLNCVFVFGWYGMPAMGGVGCGVATSVIYWVQFILLTFFVLRHRKHRFHRKHIFALRAPQWTPLLHILKLGLPIGMALFCEVSIFCAAAMILAPLGTTILGAHQVTVSLSGVFFMLPLTIALAASIRVAYYLGKRDLASLRNLVRSIFVLSGIVVTGMICFIFLARIPLVRLYTNDPAIIAIAGPLLILCGLYQLADTIQIVCSGILRGCHDTSVIFIITFTSYWIIAFPVCYLLGRTDVIFPAMGATGVWIGFIVGLCVAAIFLSTRLRYRMKKMQSTAFLN